MPERPIRSSSDALASSGDEAGEALREVKDELHASLDRIAQLAGPAGSSVGMRNLTAELQEIGTAMARSLDDVEERVTETFAAESDALESLLQAAHKPAYVVRDDAVSTRPPVDAELPSRLNSKDGNRSITPSDGSAEQTPERESDLDKPNRSDLGTDATGEGADVDGPQDSADSLRSGSAVASDTGVGNAPDSGAVRDSRSDESASRSQSAAEIRRLFLEHADDVDSGFDVIGGVFPPQETPQPPLGVEVDNPTSAVTLVTMITWELISQLHKRRKARNR